MDEDNLSFVSYDNYSVSGQGISGTMKPQLFEPGSLINSPKKSTNGNGYSATYLRGTNSFTKKINDIQNDIHFYFENENVCGMYD